MSLLLGMMCIFAACSAPSGAPERPNLVVTVAPGAAQVGIDGVQVAKRLSHEEVGLESRRATMESYVLAPGSYYTINVEAQGHAAFSRKYFLRDGRKIDLKVGLARKGGKLPEGGYAEAFEAEQAKVSKNLIAKEGDSGASSGSYLVQPSEVANTEQAGQDAHVNFFAPEDGSYTLWARMFASSDDDDAFYLGFNGTYQRSYPSDKGSYVWVKVAETNLKAGGNRISIGHAEAGARLDVILVTNKVLAVSELDEFVTTVEETESDVSTPNPSPKPVAEPGAYEMRGDPNFSEASLSAEQRKWYARLWAAIGHSNLQPNALAYADQDNIYEHARHVSTHNRSLLMAFRVTGDLRLLDEVDKTAQLMRRQLKDSWCTSSNTLDTKYGVVSGQDGYLNWVQKVSSADAYNYCRDIHELEEALAHGHIALLMYAFHQNRDLESPSGVDYAERADFWLDYLLNHFEAKWRERSGVQFPDMNFFERRHYAHTHMQLLTYFYYVGKRLEDDGDPRAKAYLDEAMLMTDQSFNTPYIRNEQGGGFINVDTPIGPALVYAYGTAFGDGDLLTRATPTVYARRVTEGMLEMHLEGFYRWADRSFMERVANGIAYFVMDTNDIAGTEKPFAHSVTGDNGAAGIPGSGYRGRLDKMKYAISSFAFLAPWNQNGRIHDVNQQVYGAVAWNANEPQFVALPSSMFFYESY